MAPTPALDWSGERPNWLLNMSGRLPAAAAAAAASGAPSAGAAAGAGAAPVSLEDLPQPTVDRAAIVV